MPKPPKSSTTPPSESDQAWIKHVQSEIQQEPTRVEETAKFLVGIISISLTIFMSNRSEQLADWTGSWFVAATVIWMLSALLSFFVLFPWRYRFNEDSPEDIKGTYRRITRVKMRLLVGSLGCFFVALGVAAYAFLAG